MARAARPAPRRRGVLPWVAGAAAFAVVATLAVVVDGYDAQEVPPLSSSVWVTRDSGQYARVNTELAEIDTVRAVDDPDGVVQDGDTGLVFTQGLGRVWPIDAAHPADLVGGTTTDGTAASGEATPGGTREVVQGGSWIAYLTTTGAAYLGALPAGDEIPAPRALFPFRDEPVAEGEQPRPYAATAVAVDETGLVALYSSAEGSIRLYDAATDSFRDAVEVPDAPAADVDVDLALAGGRWALLDAESGRLWLPGRAPLDLGLDEAAVLQRSSAAVPLLHVADRQRLLTVDPATGEVATLLDDAAGIPAPPVVVAGAPLAAWVSPSSALLWTADGAVDLEVPPGSLDDVDQPIPVIRSNGERAVLNETASGMLWRLPDGAPIPVEQWSLDDEADRDQGTVEVDDVAEQEPPVAVADAFGVRPGDLVLLPLLLNDHDPNKKDVLTIAPESITPLDAFGTVSLAADNQQAVVRVAAGSGSATFSYQVTDGVALSSPAVVTLTVVADDVNTAPEWCGVENCVQEWPSPGLSAGGTVTVPVLAAWVDHEGDVIVLADAAKDDPAAPVTVVATASGEVVVRHQDPNAGDAVIPITVTVADARGATATRTLEIRVTANPALVAEPIAVVAGVDEKVTVGIAGHVRGGSGSYAVLDAVQTSSAGGLVVVPNGAAGTIDLTASTPGEYVVTYTVQDLQTLAQQSAIVRVTVVGAGTPLSMAPITAFVRANEDATVDVLAAVQNTSGRVLIVSEAISSTPALGVSVVGQSRVRVSGATADGQPGRIGTATVTVTDGAGASVEGTVTVFLVPTASTTGPIAVPDTVTVRAGSLADIPVLANDVSPRGERVVLHPDLPPSGAEGELAFVAGDRVRYLAPEAPGIYTLRYTAYLENAPQLVDSATVTVTVLPPDANRAPQPPILTGRVLAGQSVAIPFPGTGMDPDGDRVVLADVGQPDSGRGIAEISAEGDAIVYTAPGNGVDGGQVSFAYRVRDAEGAVAEGVVRIGVLASEAADVAPITYGDYVRVQAGSESPLTVVPLLNDRDPFQGRLELLNVVPNAPAGSAEYDRLLGLLDDSGLAGGEVGVRAGDVLGVHSYVYTVVAETSFSTAQGLIVVSVTDGPTPDAPVVTDTVVTAENRAELASGLDVVSGKVQWASGEVEALELSIWGPAASRYAVDGWAISGDLPAAGEIVPFALTGPAPGGGEVTSYGFLRIPAFDDMRIQLRPGVEPVPVDEEGSAEFAVRALLDLDPRDEVEVRDDARFAVQRANSSCTLTGDDRVTYAAGREAPWTDTCTVPVRIEGQRTWTLLGIPVIVRPKDPQAILTSISRTVPPGEADRIDLYADMTSWEGARVGDLDALQYRILYAGSVFTVTQGADGIVEVKARADARPGTRETIQVSVDAFGGLRAGITLVVGIAPPDAPRGATLTQVCTVTDGACSITVVGRPGEYDPFQGDEGSGLKVVGVGAGSTAGGVVTCPVASVRVLDARQLQATWPSGAKPVGGECVVPFTVADAQGRTGPGMLRIDVQGYPQTPQTVQTTAYTATSVTLRVPLGEALNAHPAVTGVALYEAGSRVPDASCSPVGAEYQCVVGGLVNGDDHRFTARAVNSVGESGDTTPHRTNAYDRPRIDALSSVPVYRPGVTTEGVGVVALTIEASEAARSYRVMAGSATVATISRSGPVTTADVRLTPGSQQLTVVPISQFSPPTGGSGEGDAATVTARPAGSPGIASHGSITASTATSLTLGGAAITDNGSLLGTTQVWAAWLDGDAAPTCSATSTGGFQLTGGGSSLVTSTSSSTLTLTSNRYYRMAMCASNGYGAIMTNPARGFTFSPPLPPAGTYTYTIDTAPQQSGRTYRYELSATPAAPPAIPDYDVVWLIGGAKTDSFDLTPGTDTSNLQVMYCVSDDDELCSGGTDVTTTNFPNPIRVQFPSSCSGTPSVQGASADIAVEPGDGFLDPTVIRVTFTGTWAPLGVLEEEYVLCTP